MTDGFDAWVGGECIYICLKAIWPSIEERIPNHMAQSTGVTTAQFILGIYHFYGHFDALTIHTTTQAAAPILCFCLNRYGVHSGSADLVDGHYGPSGVR